MKNLDWLRNSALIAAVTSLLLTGCAGDITGETGETGDITEEITQDGPIILTAASFTPISDPGADGLQLLAEKVEQKSNGGLIIDIVGGPEVTGPVEQVTAVRSGVFDMSLNWAFLTEVPEFQAAHLSQLQPWEERDSGLHDFYVEAFQREGFYYLGRSDFNTPFWMWTTQKAEIPEDLSNLRFRSVPIHEPVINLLGGRGVAIDFAEVYTAVDTGVIDVVLSPMTFAVSAGLPEVAPYRVGPSYFPASNVVVGINLSSWNELPPEMQDILVEAQKETEREVATRKEAANAQAWEEANRAGAEPLEWSEEDVEWFLEGILDASWEVMGDHMDDETVDAIRKMME
jgi:TRAP-type C4-dicarboxylate transport system substrate-binding protein